MAKGGKKGKGGAAAASGSGGSMATSLSLSEVMDGKVVVMEFSDKEAMAVALGRVSAYSEGSSAKGERLISP
jgi:hypothetical protein